MAKFRPIKRYYRYHRTTWKRYAIKWTRRVYIRINTTERKESRNSHLRESLRDSLRKLKMADDMKVLIYEVNDKGCHVCISHRPNKEGYINVKVKGLHYRLHRYIYQKIKLNGEPIPDGIVVRHTCDNKICVNPEHLIPGTQYDNVEDMVNRNRQSKGEEQWYSKLTEVQVLEIYNSKEIGVSIAKRMNIDSSTVYHIRAGRTWRWLTNRK